MQLLAVGKPKLKSHIINGLQTPEIPGGRDPKSIGQIYSSRFPILCKCIAQTRTYLPLTPFRGYASMSLLERGSFASREKLKNGVFAPRQAPQGGEFDE